MHADAHRDAREREHGKQPRQAPEREREPERRSRARRRQPPSSSSRAVRRDRGAEHARAERGEAEAGDALALRLRDEQQREPETGDRPAEMREADHRTNTAARLDVAALGDGERVAARASSAPAAEAPATTPCRAARRAASVYCFASVETPIANGLPGARDDPRRSRARCSGSRRARAARWRDRRAVPGRGRRRRPRACTSPGGSGAVRAVAEPRARCPSRVPVRVENARAVEVEPRRAQACSAT